MLTWTLCPKGSHALDEGPLKMLKSFAGFMSKPNLQGFGLVPCCIIPAKQHTIISYSCMYIYIDTTRYDYNRLYSTKCDCLPHPHSPGESRERLYICAPFYCFGEGRLLQGKPGEECQANATHEWFWNQQEEKIESNPLSPSVWCQPFSSFLGCPEVVGTIYT